MILRKDRKRISQSQGARSQVGSRVSKAPSYRPITAVCPLPSLLIPQGLHHRAPRGQEPYLAYWKYVSRSSLRDSEKSMPTSMHSPGFLFVTRVGMEYRGPDNHPAHRS